MPCKDAQMLRAHGRAGAAAVHGRAASAARDGEGMQDFEQLKAEAEQFRASGSLGKPGSLSRLFDFLLARTLAGDAPKEIEIALEVFGKSPTFDVSQDAVVRVYVHKLRRRLDEFHTKTGGASRGRLTIPKGEYRLVFEQSAEVVADEPALAKPAAAERKSNRWMKPTER